MLVVVFVYVSFIVIHIVIVVVTDCAFEVFVNVAQGLLKFWKIGNGGLVGDALMF